LKGYAFEVITGPGQLQSLANDRFGGSQMNLGVEQLQAQAALV